MLIALSGLKGSGKDTAAEVMVAEYGFTRIAFADALREALLTLDPWIAYAGHGYGTLPLSELIEDAGWDWAKRNIPEVRRLMQVFGTEVGRMLMGENVWVNQVLKTAPDLTKPNTKYVIADCRFDNEANFVHQYHGSIVWIDRPGLQSDGHASESCVVKDKADYFINNDSTLEEFQEDIRFLLYMKGFDPIERSGDVTESTQ